MVMGTMNEFHLNQLISSNKLVNPNPFIQQDQFLHIPSPFLAPDENPAGSLNSSPEENSHEDSEIFSDIALNYINQILDDEDDKIANFPEYSALEATEKPFYEILGKKYPPSPVAYPPTFESNHSSASPDSFNSGASRSNTWSYEHLEYQLPIEFASQSSFGTINRFGSTLEDSWDCLDEVSDLFVESLPEWHFQQGVEEARKFLPSGDKLVIDLESKGSSVQLEPKKESKVVGVKREKEEAEYPYDLSLEEGRSAKQPSVSSEDALRSDQLDDVLLCSGGTFPKVINDLREALQHVIESKSSQNGPAKGSKGGKGRGKKQPKKEVVDLSTLLIQCAQMVAANDHRSTAELLRQIRQHSSPYGDGSQRLAHYFANGIETRLAGTGSELYLSFWAQRRTVTSFLKAYQLYLAACPFKKISHFFSNQTIRNASEKAARVHIIDYGINYGFQWPSLIQCISSRPGGPPRLRITGIDFPQPGFRPSERIEETGRRLAEYARSFNVPFEYKYISSKWEDVRVEDLDLDSDEVLVVNCLFQSKYLADETVMVDSPRNMVLNTIRKMNPDVFVHCVINGLYNAPFFVTRFREAMYHFSALYDMLESIVPREDEQRLLIERELFGREAVNVIACEGSERMERPETYKQWQARNLRAGFVQQPLSQEMVKQARNKVKDFYHKDFNIHQDSRWLLQGWKGRIMYALSAWKPNNS